jgi:hypothetical protein
MRSSLKPLATALLLLSSGCAGNRPITLDAGTVDKGVYRNGYFGFSMPIPAGAEITSKAETNEFVSQGVKTVLDPKLDPKIVEEAKAGLTTLLFFYVKATARKADDSVMVTVSAVKITPDMGFENPDDYVRQMTDMLKSGPAKAQPQGPAYSAQVGGRRFAAQDCSMSISGEPARITMMSAFMRGYAFILSTTYSNDAGRKRAQDVVSSARF